MTTNGATPPVMTLAHLDRLVRAQTEAMAAYVDCAREMTENARIMFGVLEMLLDRVEQVEARLMKEEER